MKNRIKIYVDGKSFTLVGEETEIHMQAVSNYIHEKIVEIRKNAAAVRLDTSLAYVLTALNVADDYFKEKERVAELEGRNLGLLARLEELASQLEEARAEIKKLQETPTQPPEEAPEAEAARAEVIAEEKQEEDAPPNAEAEEEAEPVIAIKQEEIAAEKGETEPDENLNETKTTGMVKPQSRRSKRGKYRKR